MAGFKVVTNHVPEKALKLAWRVAQDLGFQITPLTEGAKSFEARKGHVLMSLLFGALAPACRFRISVENYDSGTEIILDENSGALVTGAVTGSVGMSRVRRQASDLADAIAEGLRKEGACVLEQKEF